MKEKESSFPFKVHCKLVNNGLNENPFGHLPPYLFLKHRTRVENCFVELYYGNI